MVFTSGSLFPFATRFSFANNQSSCNEETAGVHCTGEVLISLAGVFFGSRVPSYKLPIRTFNSRSFAYLTDWEKSKKNIRLLIHGKNLSSSRPNLESIERTLWVSSPVNKKHRVSRGIEYWFREETNIYKLRTATRLGRRKGGKIVKNPSKPEAFSVSL